MFFFLLKWVLKALIFNYKIVWHASEIIEFSILRFQTLILESHLLYLLEFITVSLYCCYSFKFNDVLSFIILNTSTIYK